MPKKTKIASPVKALKGQEKKYQRQLNKLGRALIKAVKEELLPFLKAQQPAYVADDVAEDIFSKLNSKFVKDTLVTDEEQTVLLKALLRDSRDELLRSRLADGVAPQLASIFQRLNQQFSGTIMASFAEQTSSGMVGEVNEKNQARLGRSIEGATGINLSGVVAQEGLEDFLELQITKNVSLINSLPEEYLKQVEVIVNNGVLNGSRFSTIAKGITAKTGSTNSKLAGRIKTIARNEVQTINAQMNQRRTAALGITEGIFRTSGDEKVRPCHKELNGVRYELSKGAWSKTCQRWIVPGATDINCRCSFSPVIEVQ